MSVVDLSNGKSTILDEKLSSYALDFVMLSPSADSYWSILVFFWHILTSKSKILRNGEHMFSR